MSKKAIKIECQQLMDFLNQSPTAFHAVEQARQWLAAADFEELKEKDSWNLQAGKGYYVLRNASSMIAFYMPETENKAYQGFHILASHSDSPGFQVKEKPMIAVDGQYVKLNVEGYGAMLIAPWFDRPLSVAGRVMVREDGRLSAKLVNIDRDLLLIPSVAIHMNREANHGYSYNIQQDCLPLFALSSAKASFEQVVADAANVKKEDILSWNLFLYNRQPASCLGAAEEFIASGRLDDLQCVFGSLKGLTETVLAQREAKKANAPEGTGKKKAKKVPPLTHIPMVAILDNEEVGSKTKQGADSTFLSDVLQRIMLCGGCGPEVCHRLLADSFLISADNAHAVHPNQPQLSDLTNRCYINGGIVLKFHSGQKYTTDAPSAAVVRLLCKQAKLSCQTFYNRSDMAGGATLGHLLASHVSIPSADIGLPQLAMHSPYEVAGTKDTRDLIVFCRTFFESASLLNES